MASKYISELEVGDHVATYGNWGRTHSSLWQITRVNKQSYAVERVDFPETGTISRRSGKFYGTANSYAHHVEDPQAWLAEKQRQQQERKEREDAAAQRHSAKIYAVASANPQRIVETTPLPGLLSLSFINAQGDFCWALFQKEPYKVYSQNDFVWGWRLHNVTVYYPEGRKDRLEASRPGGYTAVTLDECLLELIAQYWDRT